MRGAALHLCPLLLVLLLANGCSQEPPRFNSRFLAFGTLMELTLAGVERPEAERISQQIESDFAAMHEAWHAWEPGPLALINGAFAAGKPIVAAEVVLPLIQLSSKLSQRSEGLFNPAIGSLVDLWGFHRDDPRGGRPPPREEIELLVRQQPRMENISIAGAIVTSSNPAVKLDFGGIGKGYGIDFAISRLQRLGVTNAIVNGGGDLRAIGNRGDGTPWRIAIRHPDGEQLIGSIEIAGDESVFTSGGYERNYLWEGESYHHIIDPRSGYPARGTASVTVVHSDAATADAAATALFIAGPEAWHQIARQMGLRMVLLMSENGELYMNPAMRNRVTLADESRQRIHLSPPLKEQVKGGSS